MGVELKVMLAKQYDESSYEPVAVIDLQKVGNMFNSIFTKEADFPVYAHHFGIDHSYIAESPDVFYTAAYGTAIKENPYGEDIRYTDDLEKVRQLLDINSKEWFPFRVLRSAVDLAIFDSELPRTYEESSSFLKSKSEKYILIAYFY